MVDKIYLAMAELIGTIIGAGFLAIPFVMMKSGAPIGLLHLLIIGIIISITMLYLGEIALRTKANHQLTGYASKYLGRLGKKIMFISVAFGVYSSILAYLIAEGISISHLIFNSAEYAFPISLIFWAFLSFLTYKGIKALKKGESFSVFLILIIISLITIIYTPEVNIDNLTYINLVNAFLPFGVILFAYQSFTAITEVKLILGKERDKMKNTIVYAHIIAFVVYAIFGLVVLGVKGLATPEIATLSLGKPFIFLGILTMLTSYLSLSISLMDNLRFDYEMHKMKAGLYTILVPLILFIILTFIEKTSFILVLGIGGVISGGLTAILILLMHNKAQKLGDRKPEYSLPNTKIISIILALIFIVGAIIEIMHSIN